jgi:hypothetical protein
LSAFYSFEYENYPRHSFTMAANSTKSHPSPLTKSGTLDKQFKYEEATPVVGREYPDVNIVDDVLNAPNSDELIRDLAITSKLSQHH